MSGEIASGTSGEAVQSDNQGLAARVGGFVDRHVLVPDTYSYHVEGHGSGWAAGIAPANRTPEYVEDLLTDLIKDHWDSAIQSMGSSSETN